VSPLDERTRAYLATAIHAPWMLSLYTLEGVRPCELLTRYKARVAMMRAELRA
jgi:hypothetical protein